MSACGDAMEYCRDCPYRFGCPAPYPRGDACHNWYEFQRRKSAAPKPQPTEKEVGA
jgi:hypothetical protein